MKRRGQILRVASAMFSENGPQTTSMRRIASAAGVTATLLYKHFAGKEELLMAIGDEFFAKLAARMHAAVEAQADPVERLCAMMRAYLTCGIDNPREYRLTFMTALPWLRQPGEMKAFRERARRGAIDANATMGMRCFALLERTVSDVVGAKLTQSTDTAALSEVVWAGGHGLVSLLITHDNFGFSEPKHLIDAAIELMLGGLLTPTAMHHHAADSRPDLKHLAAQGQKRTGASLRA